MVASNSLAKLDRATQMLAEVRSVDDAVKIIDLAEAARVDDLQTEDAHRQSRVQ